MIGMRTRPQSYNEGQARVGARGTSKRREPSRLVKRREHVVEDCPVEGANGQARTARLARRRRRQQEECAARVRV